MLRQPRARVQPQTGALARRFGADKGREQSPPDFFRQPGAIVAHCEHRLIAASANDGTIYRAEPASEGTFESTVHEAKSVSRWGRMRWVAALPPGGQMLVETRSGNTPEPDTTWSDWGAPRPEATGTYAASPAARYLQYRVRFHSVPPVAGTVAALREMSVIYMPRNEAPAVALTTPSGGEIWRGRQTLKWSGSDPNKDTLSYEVSYSPDAGRTWKPGPW